MEDNRQEGINPKASDYAEILINLGVPINAINFIAENFKPNPSFIAANPLIYLIKGEVSKEFGLYYDEKENIYEMDVLAKEETLAISRQFTAYFSLRYTNASLSTIGGIIGKDHATVIHSRKVIGNYIETSKKHREIYERIDKNISALVLKPKYPRV